MTAHAHQMLDMCPRQLDALCRVVAAEATFDTYGRRVFCRMSAGQWEDVAERTSPSLVHHARALAVAETLRIIDERAAEEARKPASWSARVLVAS